MTSCLFCRCSRKVGEAGRDGEGDIGHAGDDVDQAGEGVPRVAGGEGGAAETSGAGRETAEVHQIGAQPHDGQGRFSNGGHETVRGRNERSRALLACTEDVVKSG